MRAGMAMEAPVTKRSIVIAGRKTSISLEDDFWTAFKEIASVRELTLTELIGSIDSERIGNLSSAIRLFVLAHYRDMIGTPAASQSTDTEPQNMQPRGSVPRSPPAGLRPTPIDELLADTSFDPEYHAVLREAFHAACADLGLSEHARSSRAFVGKRIMALADGQRDAEAIRRAVVSFLKSPH